MKKKNAFEQKIKEMLVSNLHMPGDITQLSKVTGLKYGTVYKRSKSPRTCLGWELIEMLNSLEATDTDALDILESMGWERKCKEQSKNSGQTGDGDLSPETMDKITSCIIQGLLEKDARILVKDKE